MERKEAIERLKQLRLDYTEFWEEIKNETTEALDIAIASLETDEAFNLMYEQPEFCEDCISREKVLDEITDYFDMESNLYKIIERMPSVLPKTTKNDCENCIHNKGVLECDMYGCKYEPTTKNDLGVDWESYKDVDGNCLDDLILEVLQNNFDCGNTYGYKVADEIIGLLPPVTPQEPRWIPVSEKLPNDRDWYLGIFKEPDTGWINPLPFICDYVGHETKATTKEHWILRGFTDWDDYHIDYYFNLECVAWMSLPKAYRGDKE